MKHAYLEALSFRKSLVGFTATPGRTMWLDVTRPPGSGVLMTQPWVVFTDPRPNPTKEWYRQKSPPLAPEELTVHADAVTVRALVLSCLWHLS